MPDADPAGAMAATAFITDIITMADTDITFADTDGIGRLRG